MKILRSIRYFLTGLFLILVALNYILGVPLFALLTGIIGLAAGVLFLLQAFQK